MKEKVIKILDKIRPSLQADGGDIELVRVDEKEGIVDIRLKGRCVNCPMAKMTFEHGIDAAIKREIKDVKKVNLLTVNT